MNTCRHNTCDFRRLNDKDNSNTLAVTQRAWKPDWEKRRIQALWPTEFQGRCAPWTAPKCGHFLTRSPSFTPRFICQGNPIAAFVYFPCGCQKCVLILWGHLHNTNFGSDVEDFRYVYAVPNLISQVYTCCLLCNISQSEKLSNWLNGVGEVSTLKLETLNLARYYQWHSCLVGWKLPMEMLFPRHNVVRSSIHPRVAWLPALKKLFLKSLSTPTWRNQVEAHINSWYAQLSWKTFPNFPSENLSKTWELAKQSYAKSLKTSYKVQYRPYLRVQGA